MAASISNSARTVEVSLFIVRVFVALRRAISEHKELARKITQLESLKAGRLAQAFKYLPQKPAICRPCILMIL